MKAYYNGYQRVGVAKVHIVRTTPVGYRYSRPGPERNQAWCGVSATGATNSPRVPVDPNVPLQPGLAWCGHCVGRAAEHAGLLPEVVAVLVAKAVTT